MPAGLGGSDRWYQLIEPVMNTVPTGIPDFQMLMKSTRAAEDAGQYKQAYELLKRCEQMLATGHGNNAARRYVGAGLWRLAPLWWANLQHDGICLRRCQAKDADFFQKCFADQQFCRQFNRQWPWPGKLPEALAKHGKLPPIQSRQLMWVVEFGSLGAIGVASLSSIDMENRRVELAIGFPGEVPPSVGKDHLDDASLCFGDDAVQQGLCLRLRGQPAGPAQCASPGVCA